MNLKVKNLSGEISIVTINEPKTYNALFFRNLNDLIKVFKKLNNDKKIKVIILEGSGKGFSAGHNLKEVKNLKVRNKYQKLFNLCSKLMLQIVEGRKPVIAKVHGAAYAAGCQLVASCDLAYSTRDALFATPGVNIGLFCSTPMVAVSRKISRKPMMKMLLTGEPIKANYAKEIGLINDYFPKSKLNNEVLKVAKKIASKSNLTIKIGKQAFYKQLEMPLKKAYAYTSKMMTINMMAMDAKEGISAFLDKENQNGKISESKNFLTIILIIGGLYLIFTFRDHNFKRAIDACIAGSQKLEKPMTVQEAKKFCEDKIMSKKIDNMNIKEILSKYKNIALIGASKDLTKTSSIVMKYLKEHGFKVYPVNPSMKGEKILDEKVFGNISEIDSPVEIIDVFRPSNETIEIAKEAVKIKAKVLWLQLDIKNEEAKRIVEANNILYIENKCTKIEFEKYFN